MQVIVTQVPAPPAPPMPEAVVVTGSEPPMLFIFLALLVTAVLLWPLVRALARRIEGRGDEGLQRQVDELEHRVAELSQRESRVAELEERLDFAERLLAQRSEPVPLPPGREPR